MLRFLITSVVLFLLAAPTVFSQNLEKNLKKNPPSKSGGDPIPKERLKLRALPKHQVPADENPFGVQDFKFKTLEKMQSPAEIEVLTGEKGLPIFFRGLTAASQPVAGAKPAAARAIDYLVSLRPPALDAPAEEFLPTRSELDEQGGEHFRLQQMHRGLPVFGGEVIAHSKNGVFEMLNGRYFPSPKIEDLTPVISAAAAVESALQTFPVSDLKNEWSDFDLKLVGGKRFESELVIFHQNEDFENEKLAWRLTVRPNLLRRVDFFVDARNGAILESFDRTCKIDGGRCTGVHSEVTPTSRSVSAAPTDQEVGVTPPPVTGSGLDLFNTNRSFGAWREGSVYYMEDASKAMFNSAGSSMPNDPVGAIVTIDAFNTSPEKSNFNYDVVVSNSTTFNNKAAVSAHYNSVLCYDYFKNTFNRNSINGAGGNILAFVNVADSDGSSMGNAFWNGDAMWYGNGDATFQPLARGLDVGGHEMTHGVVEKTANLVYQNESGALNESFADIFGAMIDRDDWKMGEDVMKAGVTVNNCLRSLEDPNNKEAKNSPFWQPKHTNDQYKGTQDNGGVHINSGITNYAFYLFATNASVGKDKAEQVYYKALRDYLVKSSKFLDCRAAVVQAAKDLYGQAVADIAAGAFTSVGIGSGGSGGGGGNSGGTVYQGNLATNPGTDYILVTTPDYSKIDLAVNNGQVLGALYEATNNNTLVASRPSITDDGSVFVFVTEQGHIVAVDVVYGSTDITTQETQISDSPDWRNVAISKDSRYIAAITKTLEPKIYIFDLHSPTGEYQEFDLYNPTYTQGQITLDVQYADVLEFDYSNKYLMYDAYTENTNTSGDKIGYWDIGFINFWQNGFTDGKDDITKLFNGLPEKTSIGNPTFSKNSPYIIAFDVIDELNDRYDIFGANLETGDNSAIASNVDDLGWPNYNRLDNSIIYQNAAENIRRQGVAASKIAGSGSSTAFISQHIWPVWYGNGKRSLVVDADEPTAVVARLEAFPNPVAENLTLKIFGKKSASAQVSVFNSLGQQVSTRNLDLSEGQNSLDLPMGSLPAGNYLIQVLSENAVSTVKVVRD